MRAAAIKPGAIVEARVRGITFLARVLRVLKGLIEVDPIEKWATWRRLKPSQVLRVVDMQERLV